MTLYLVVKQYLYHVDIGRYTSMVLWLCNCIILNGNVLLLFRICLLLGSKRPHLQHTALSVNSTLSICLMSWRISFVTDSFEKFN